MSFAKILLGTARSPMFSLASSAICFATLTQLPRTIGFGFLPGFGIGGALACCLLVTASPTNRQRRTLHRATSYRLLVLLLAAGCVWISQQLVPPGECPSQALMTLGGIVPMILGGISGAQCAFGTLHDLLRISAFRPRRSLLATVQRREWKRWASAHGLPIGRPSR